MNTPILWADLMAFGIGALLIFTSVGHFILAVAVIGLILYLFFKGYMWLADMFWKLFKL